MGRAVGRIKERGSDYYRIRLKRGVIPVGDGEKELSVIDCFMKYPMVAFHVLEQRCADAGLDDPFGFPGTVSKSSH